MTWQLITLSYLDIICLFGPRYVSDFVFLQKLEVYKNKKFALLSLFIPQRITKIRLLQKIVLDGNIETRYNDFLNSMKDKVIFKFW